MLMFVITHSVSPTEAALPLGSVYPPVILACFWNGAEAGME